MNKPASADLAARHCKTCEKGAAALSDPVIAPYLESLPQWRREGVAIQRELKFKNYYETIAFVNALAWISHREDHHPDLEVGYNRVLVRYSTHSAGGLSENDFICAAKADALVA